jgi:hypothetical protein
MAEVFCFFRRTEYLVRTTEQYQKGLNYFDQRDICTSSLASLLCCTRESEDGHELFKLHYYGKGVLCIS